MPGDHQSSQVDSDLLRKSNLYREFQAEREEILRHKWIESEKVGYDIGFERALIDWVVRHRKKWRKSRQEPDQPPEQAGKDQQSQDRPAQDKKD